MRAPLCAMTGGKGKTVPVAVNSLPLRKDLSYLQLCKSAGGWNEHQRGKPCAIPYRCMASYEAEVVMLPVWVIHWHLLMFDITEYATPFPEGSHYPISSMPKPVPLHKYADMTIPACPTWLLMFQFLGARSPSVILRSHLSLWCLFALGVGDQVPSHEDRPRIKLNSVKRYWLSKHWQSDWWVGLPNSVLGRCDLLRICLYNVCPCAGDSVHGSTEIPASHPPKLHTSITLSWNICCGACWDKGFLFYLKDRKLLLFCSLLYCVAAHFFPGLA